MGCLPTRPSVSSCIQKLRGVIKTLNDVIANAERQQATLRIDARDALRKKQRQRATYLVKRAKQYDKQIGEMHRRVLACTQKIILLQNMHMSSLQLDALQQATRTFRGFVRQHDVDRVEKLRDELEDHMEQVMEIDDIMRMETYDDEDVEEELLELLPDTHLASTTHDDIHLPHAPGEHKTRSTQHARQHIIPGRNEDHPQAVRVAV